MNNTLKLAFGAVACATALAAFSQSPAHDALRREIAELQKRPVVFELPPYLPPEQDFGDVCKAAGEKKKKLLVSIGREACGRCQRFYELVRRGDVKIDTNAFVFVRLDIDEYTQRDYFMDAFDPPDGQLPFVGVTDAERATQRLCLTGYRTPEEYQALMGPVASYTNPVPAIGQNAEDQKAFDPAKKGPRVLFVGNSITLHGPRPQIGWTNNWGMAASARDKDYVHLLQKKIAAVRPDAQCCLLQVANTFERAFFKKDWSCERNFKWAREFKPDVIVFFFGANVPKTYNAGTMSPAPARTFGEALDAFRTYLDPEGQALVLISQGFYIRPKLDAEKEAVAKKRGDVFVNMEDIRARKDAHGRFNHPGDLGMELIAERFWQHIEKRVRDVRR